VTSNFELDLQCLAPHPEAVVAVRELLRSVHGELGGGLLATWFDGSIALGDFNSQRSDIDLVVLMRNVPSRETIEGIRTVHARSAANAAPWGDEIETIYVTPAALISSAVNSGVPHLYVERGSGGNVVSAPLDQSWLMHMRVLREHGISITGSAPSELVGVVSDDELRRAAHWGAEHWLNPYLADPAALVQLGTRVFLVLTACRLLYTSQTGQVVSKMTAATWVLESAPAELRSVIAGAMAWCKTDEVSELTTTEGTIALIAWLRGRLVET
jgi:hypothetical protein